MPFCGPVNASTGGVVVGGGLLLRDARKTMTSVTATKSRKMPMLTVGLPTGASLRRTVDHWPPRIELARWRSASGSSRRSANRT